MILDASVIVRFVLREPGWESADALVSAASAVTADLADWETPSAITRKYRRREITRDAALAAIHDLSFIPLVKLASAAYVEQAARISLETRSQFFDCVYLTLAIQRNEPLITADERFLRAMQDTPYRQHARLL